MSNVRQQSRLLRQGDSAHHKPAFFGVLQAYSNRTAGSTVQQRLDVCRVLLRLGPDKLNTAWQKANTLPTPALTNSAGPFA
jgi:hypothetical protein